MNQFWDQVPKVIDNHRLIAYAVAFWFIYLVRLYKSDGIVRGIVVTLYTLTFLFGVIFWQFCAYHLAMVTAAGHDGSMWLDPFTFGLFYLVLLMIVPFWIGLFLLYALATVICYHTLPLDYRFLIGLVVSYCVIGGLWCLAKEVTDFGIDSVDIINDAYKRRLRRLGH